MAVFNPEVAPGQDKMPSFLKGYSDPISQPKPDESGEYSGKSAGIALATAGKAIEGFAELGDQVVKGIIKNDVYSRVDPITDGYIQELKATRDSLMGTNAMPAGSDPANTILEGTPGGPMNLMTNLNSPDVPPGLANGLKNVQRLGAASAAGKPTNTLVDMRLFAELKDLRTTYPGWRDYVDATMQKATGKDIANSLVNDMRTDIARQTAGQDKEKTYWEHQIVNNAGFPKSKEMLQEYQATGNSTKVMEWLAFNQGELNKLALDKARFENQSNDTKTNVANATQLATSAANHAATIAFANDKLLKAQGGISPAQMADKLYELTANPGMANDDAYRALSAQYEAAKAKTYTQTMMLLNQKPRLANGTLGKSVVETIGPEAAKGIVNNSVGALFEKTSDYIKDKQFGPAYTLGEAAEATQRNRMFQVLQSPALGPTVGTVSIFNKLIPQLSPVLTGKLLGDNLDTDTSVFIKQMGMQGVAQTGGYRGADGKTYTFNQSLDEMRQAGNITGTPLPGQAYNNLLSVTKVITDPSAGPQAKKNAITYFYDPDNKGTMSKFMDDYYDQVSGRTVKGRSSAFGVLTGPEVTKSIREYSQAYEPEAWGKYSSWAKGEAFGLIRSSISDINKTVDRGDYKVTWDSANTRLKIANPDGSDLRGIAATGFNPPNRTVQNLNTVMSNMANLAKAEGTNVDAYIFKVLKDSGFSPTKDIDGIPAQIMRSMIISNGHKLKERGPSPAANFTKEEDASLEAFLRSPAGQRGPSQPEPLQPHQTRGVISGNLSDQPIDAPIRTLR